MPVQSRRRTPESGRDSLGSAQASAPGSRSRRAGRPPRRKDPLWARLMASVGALLMMLSGLAIVGGEALISQATGNIERENLLGDAGKTEAEGGNNLEGPIDLLLLGVDARTRTGPDDVRADTIVVLHIPATHDQAYLISIPRDTEAHIPAFPRSGYGGGVGKINGAFFHGLGNGQGWKGGAQLMAATIKRMTGISFDGAAIIDFNGFKGVIDALGSIRICVKEQTRSLHMTLVDGKPMWNADARKVGGNKEPVVHKKGCREMAGWEALDYSRQRKDLTNGDYDRQQNQQQLIKAMAKKAMESGVATNPLKLKRLLEAAGKAFVLDTGGVEIADFLFTLRGVAANDLVLLRTNGGTFNSNGNGNEALDAQTLEMFAAVKEDRLGQFVVENPGVLAGPRS